MEGCAIASNVFALSDYLKIDKYDRAICSGVTIPELRIFSAKIWWTGCLGPLSNVPVNAASDETKQRSVTVMLWATPLIEQR